MIVISMWGKKSEDKRRIDKGEREAEIWRNVNGRVIWVNAGSFVTLNDRVTARSKRIPSINRHAIPPRLKRARFVLFLAWCEKPSSARDRVKSETKLNTKRRENGVAEQERKVGKRKRCGVTFFSPLSPLSSTLSSTLKVSPTSHSYSPIRIYVHILFCLAFQSSRSPSIKSSRDLPSNSTSFANICLRFIHTCICIRVKKSSDRKV